MTKQELIQKLADRNDRSAWNRGVTQYAIDLLDNVTDDDMQRWTTRTDCDKCLLNGADTWSQYSWGGCALVYDYDIAYALCAPWELRRTRNGERNPNSREQWLDVQARALYQASNRIWRTYKA